MCWAGLGYSLHLLSELKIVYGIAILENYKHVSDFSISVSEMLQLLLYCKKETTK